MSFHLVVLKPFDGFKRGDVITDATSVQKICPDRRLALLCVSARRGFEPCRCFNRVR